MEDQFPRTWDTRSLAGSSSWFPGYFLESLDTTSTMIKIGRSISINNPQFNDKKLVIDHQISGVYIDLPLHPKLDDGETHHGSWWRLDRFIVKAVCVCCLLGTATKLCDLGAGTTILEEAGTAILFCFFCSSNTLIAKDFVD